MENTSTLKKGTLVQLQNERGEDIALLQTEKDFEQEELEATVSQFQSIEYQILEEVFEILEKEGLKRVFTEIITL